MVQPILKVHSGCNIHCDYCVVDGKKSGELMDLDIFEEVVEQTADINNSVKLTFHGGEPLLAGKDFFREASEIASNVEDEKEVEISKSVQTNGTLVDKEFAEILHQNNFGVGVSIDGPEEIHNAHRGTRGTGSYQKVVEGINNLKDIGVHPGTITVATSDTVGREEEVYEEIRSHSHAGRINPVISADPRLKLDNQELESLYKSFYDLWSNEEDEMMLAPFDGIVASFVKKGEEKGRDCSFSKCPSGGIIGVDPEGNIYPCGDLMDEEFKITNILENTDAIEKAQEEANPYLREQREEVIGDTCSECRYQTMCHGGCAANAYFVTQDFRNKDPECETRKSLFEYIEEDLTA